MRLHWLAGGEARSDLIQRRAFERTAKFAKKILRQGHTLQRRASFQRPVDIGGDVPDLNHGRHAISIPSSKSHANRQSACDGLKQPPSHRELNAVATLKE
jgi:hypothetical protein